MKANKFSGTGGLQHRLWAASCPCKSRVGTLSPENLWATGTCLYFAQKFDKDSLPFSCWGSGLSPCLRLRFHEVRPWQSRQGRHRCKGTQATLHTAWHDFHVTGTAHCYSAKLQSASSHLLWKTLDRQDKGTARFGTCSTEQFCVQFSAFLKEFVEVLKLQLTFVWSFFKLS